MAGLFHDFIVLSRMDYDYTDYMKLINHPEALHVHDDIIRYIGDSLVWVTCYSPGKNRMPKHKGLNLYGPTIIKKDGAETAWRIFRAWAELFACGPEELEITGSYIVTGEEENAGSGYQVTAVDSGSYEKIRISRDRLVGQFQKLAAYCYEVIEGADDVYLLHLGI
jgi:hypothetical protein